MQRFWTPDIDWNPQISWILRPEFGIPNLENLELYAIDGGDLNALIKSLTSFPKLEILVINKVSQRILT